MFEFYLAGSELAFRQQDHVNFQVQITREQSAAPLVRDYITDTDRQMMRTQTADRNVLA
jgi:cyclopropane-fatty-acyl-phospholipid synthase